MKRKVTLTIIGLFILGFVSAQDYYLSLGTGIMKEEYTIIGGSNNIKAQTDVLYPTANLNFKTIFKNNIEVGTGLRFYNYGYKIGFLTSDGNKKHYPYSTETAYRAISIPISIGYNLFFIPNRLGLNFNTAVNFDFYFDHSNGQRFGSYGALIDDAPRYFYEYGTPDLTRQFNVLIANQISLQYITKFNMCISIFAAYHAGLRDIWHSAIYYTKEINNNIEAFAPIFTSRGSYWHFGIEIGYKFKVRDYY
jgi:hypothetical protein